MNRPPFITAKLLRRDDRTLASAFLGIEERLNLARLSVIAAEMLFADAWACGPQVLSDTTKVALGLGSRHQVLVVTDDQFRAVELLIQRARADVEALLDAYYAGLQPSVQPAA